MRTDPTPPAQTDRQTDRNDKTSAVKDHKMYSRNYLTLGSSFMRTTALASLLALGVPLGAQAQAGCDLSQLPLPEGCEHPNAGMAVDVPLGANTETATGTGFGDTGFSISVDNTPIAGAQPPYNPQRTQDIALAKSDVDVRYEGLITQRLLNVSTDDLRSSYQGGTDVTFRTSANYPHYIARAELRILDLSKRGNPVVATVPASANGTATWTMPTDGTGEYAYVLRVIDAKGRFDETVPLTLTRTDSRFDSHATVGGPIVAAGEGEDRTRVRHIPARGGMITVSGTGGTPNGTVTVMGETVPVDAQGRFVVSRVVPAGDHIVAVNMQGRDYVRDVHIPNAEWFKTGIIDVTAGIRRDGSTGTDESYVDGRAAIYAKGTTQSGWTVTGSVDTGEGPIEDIFERLNDKDPRRVLDRLRTSNDMYPTYGDDSTWFDDTPTSGAFYLRAENDTTRITWGNFTTGITGPGLLNTTRDLYGAELQYQSTATTTDGDARFAATVYAAQPETLPQRDILRGTGGSVYFLTRQDITGGSSRVMVQQVDPDTGHIKSSATLTEGADYTVDHLQGVILLTNALASSGGYGGLISDGGGAYDLNLIVQYEYTPTTVDVDSTVFGGRVETWATDNLRIGATAMQEQTGAGDQNMAGADIRYEFGTNSYAEIEAAQTSGPGIMRSTSTDGGLTIASTGGAVGAEALGLSFDSYLDFKDLGMNRDGHLSLYYESKEAGFSTLAEDITSDQTLIGLETQIALSDRADLRFEGERFETDAGDEKQEIAASLIYQLNQYWTLEAGLAQLDQTTVGDASKTGTRTDAALRATYKASDDLTVYAFGQGTVERSGGLADNNRIGLGVDAQLTEKLSIAAEASTGDTGDAARVQLAYAPSADNEIYLGYTLDPTRNGAGSALRDQGTVVVGGRYRHSDNLSSFAESTLDLPGAKRSLTNTYGVSYSPSEAWTIAGSFETGDVRDNITGDFERTAFSLGTTWAPSQDVAARARVEYRTEDGVGIAQDRDTWMVSAGYSNKLNDNWRFLADIDALVSRSADTDYHDGEYARASVGFAYRPLDNERLNMLFRYSYLHDLPGVDQVDANGDTDGPHQRSHVLSINANYDLSRQLTLGGKIGYRASEVADRGTNLFTSNTATLAAARLDWHVVHKWDIFGETRVLLTDETGTTETGALIGVYRHLGDNAKLGLGYEWGNVSDDMTDIDYTNQGLFLNLVGKF